MTTQEEILRRALEIMFELVDEEECQECPMGKTCQGERHECVKFHLEVATRDIIGA